MQVVTLGNGISGNQYLIVISLHFFFNTCVKIIANSLTHRRCCISRSIFKRRKSGIFECRTKIVGRVCELAEYNKFAIRFIG